MLEARSEEMDTDDSGALIEDLDPLQFGHPYASNENWGACIRIVNPM